MDQLIQMDQSTHQQFIALYEAHRTPVYHLALSLLRDAAAAEDILQEVFLTLFETMAKGEPLRNLKAWLLTVTRNRCLNLLRDGRFERPEEEPFSADAMVAAITAGPDAEDEAMDRMLSRQVLACLSPEENLVFCLHCLDGYKYREIARGLELPMGTVQTRCRAARRKLQAALREWQEEPRLKEKGVSG